MIQVPGIQVSRWDRLWEAEWDTWSEGHSSCPLRTVIPAPVVSGFSLLNHRLYNPTTDCQPCSFSRHPHSDDTNLLWGVSFNRFHSSINPGRLSPTLVQGMYMLGLQEEDWRWSLLRWFLHLSTKSKQYQNFCSAKCVSFTQDNSHRKKESHKILAFTIIWSKLL